MRLCPICVTAGLRARLFLFLEHTAAGWRAGQPQCFDICQNRSKGCALRLPMARYFYLSLNQAGDVRGSEVMEMDTDQDAIKWAHRMCDNGIGKGFEVWRNGHRIHTFPGSDSAQQGWILESPSRTNRG